MEHTQEVDPLLVLCTEGLAGLRKPRLCLGVEMDSSGASPLWISAWDRGRGKQRSSMLIGALAENQVGRTKARLEAERGWRGRR